LRDHDSEGCPGHPLRLRIDVAAPVAQEAEHAA
jgi:hypothetical protein